MLLLALDTSSAAVAAAVSDGPQVLAERTTVDARRHGELLLPAVDAVLAEAGVDRRRVEAVAVGVGPGPFTGLRVGLVTARTLGLVLGVPVHGVCSLDALSLGSGLSGEHLVVTDARRREVYWARYDGRRRVEGPYVARPAEVASPLPAVGAGARDHPEAFPAAQGPVHPSAGAVCRWVAAGRPLLEPVPLYLRRPDAVVPGARKPALPR